MRTRPPAAVSLDDPDVWTSLIDELDDFPADYRRRGMRYAREGRVRNLTQDGTRWKAEVEGTGRYVTTWQATARGWVSSCTCPMGPACKHAYAVACCVLHSNASQEGVHDDPRLQRLVPDQLASYGPETRDHDDDPDFGDTDTDPTPWPAPASSTQAGAERPGRAPRRPRDLAELFARRTSAWERTQILHDLLGGWEQNRLELDTRAIQELLWEPDAELLCWRLAFEWTRRVGEPLPPALEPYRLRPDLARRHTDRALPLLERQLVEWAERRRGVPSRALRVVLRIDRAAGGEPRIDFEARITTPRLRDVPRSPHQLSQLQNEVARQPTLMSAEHAGLLDLALRSIEAGGFGRSSSGLAHLVSHAAGTGLLSWAEDCDPELARRHGVEPGAPVRWSSDRVRIVPVCETADVTSGIGFRVEWPDGSTRSLREVVYRRRSSTPFSREPGLVLADGVLYAALEEPPAELLEHLGVLGSLPVPKRGREQFLASLASAFPSLRETLGPHLRMHSTSQVVALRLHDDDWLQIRLFAHTAGPEWTPGTAVESPAALFEYLPEGRWQRARAGGQADQLEIIETAPAPAAEPAPDTEPASNPVAPDSLASGAEVWLEEPDPARTVPITSWLDQTGARPGSRFDRGGMQPPSDGRGFGWWVRLGPRTIGTLADAWELRPGDVRWLGDAAAASLLGRKRRVTARLSVLARDIDFLEVAAEWSSEEMALSDADLERLRASSLPWVKLPSGWVRREAVEVLDQTAEVLADLGVEPGGGVQRLTVWQLAQARPESLDVLERLGADPEAIAAIHRLRQKVREFDGLPSVPIPRAFQGELRPYQRQGLDFLDYTSGLGLGAILADDMGLGKTVQALAWLAHLREIRRPGPALVVCPTSVMGNWEREAGRFVPGLRVLLLGRGAERHVQRRQLGRYDLIVTNYALLRRDLEAWHKTELFAAVLDEAQNIKNPDAAVSGAARALRAQHRLALTGTPLENRALDLWSIMSFVNPGYLGPRQRFVQRYDRLDAPPHARSLLAAKLRPVLLRRLKREVASELPERIEERRDCELTGEQRQRYLVELAEARRTLLALAADPLRLRRERISILAHLTKLRQICCHPVLGGGQAGAGSGKFEALFELLEPLLAEGHKVLVFSQFVRCLELLAGEMRQRGIAFHILTGETVKRDQVVDAFQADPRPCVFLISLRAGGTGLNLTAASYVVLFDPWWNPAVEAQAIDRTHRIGQDRTVIAYRLLARGTIEEKIWELQQRKAALAKDVLGEEGFARGLDREALEYLLAEA